MHIVSFYRCPHCRQGRTLNPPLVLETPADERAIAVITNRWPHAQEPRAEGPHTQVKLTRGALVIAQFLHACPALSL